MFEGRGRPKSEDSRRRKTRFLELVAQGSRFDQAAKDAALSPSAALKVLAALGPEGVAAMRKAAA